jgi:hypothetical protein
MVNLRLKFKTDAAVKDYGYIALLRESYKLKT